MEIGEKAMATRKDKGRKWDGKSRVSNDLYRKRHEEIFGKKTPEDIEEENEEYVKELQDKL
jgi:hypothetical protein